MLPVRIATCSNDADAKSVTGALNKVNATAPRPPAPCEHLRAHLEAETYCCDDCGEWIGNNMHAATSWWRVIAHRAPEYGECYLDNGIVRLWGAHNEVLGARKLPIVVPVWNHVSWPIGPPHTNGHRSYN